VTAVRLAPWFATLPESVLGGSLYAVPRELRVDAATVLAANGCAVHADMIVSATGEQLGVSPDELLAVRAALPDARIDVHLMLVDDVFAEGQSDAVADVLRTAEAVGAERVATSPALLDLPGDVFPDLRRAGVPVWIEVGPGHDGSGLPREGVDGALVMFIRPGTTDSADPAHLGKLAELANVLPVGVDGGVTAELATASVKAGATFIVSGRALLESIQNPATTLS
jgi:pentose-5-phosphate-3-epimerase